jgi:hypothetical protein
MASLRPVSFERCNGQLPRRYVQPGVRRITTNTPALSITLILLAGLALLFSPMTPAVCAQANAPQPQEAPGQDASVDLDILSLLTSNIVFETEAQDAIWSVKAGSSRSLIQIPLLITPGKKDTDFGSSSVRVGAARFLAWRVAEPSTERAQANSDAARAIEQGLEDLPTFTRDFTITAKGRIQWKMDRFILGGSVKPVNLAAGTDQRLYALRISPQALADAAPKQPRVSRNTGESAMDYYGRSALANNEYRAAREQYMQLRDSVNKLPDHFERSAPTRVWGVFDILVFERELKLTGTSQQPWTISLDVLKTLREACNTAHQPDGQTPGQVPANYLSAMLTLGRDTHPYSQRLVAYTLSLSGAVASVKFNDPLYQLIQKILSGNDAPSRRVVIKELASVIPPSNATLTLLKNVAASDLDPRSRMETLKGMLNTDFSMTSPQTRDAIDSINRAMANPEGPPPADILRQVLESTRDKPQALEMLSEGVRFADLPASRMEQAIIFVVENAGSHPLAAKWLDQQLLGAVNPQVVLRTFEVIAAADTGGQTLTLAVNSALSILFGKPKAVAPGSGKPKVAHIASPILVPDTNHGLFRALRSADPKIRQLAWQALPNFVFNQLKPDEQPPSDSKTPAGRNRYTTLLDIALQQPITPAVVVTFFAKQPDHDKAALALVQLVLRASSETSALASRSLLAMHIPLTPAVTALPFGERAGLATRLYEDIQGKAPLTVNLLRQRIADNPLVSWFGQQISQGQLPTADSWAKAVNNESALIGLINSSDPDIGAAATAALVYQAGGSDHDALALARKFRNLPDQSQKNMTDEWNKAKAQLYLNQFQSISGPYKLILNRDNAEHMLAVVQFQTDGSTISFGNQAIALSIPEDHLAIRINKPAELKTLNTMPELANLDLDSLQPVELTRQPNGDWTGDLPVPGVTPAPQLIMRSVLGR